ncbi:MAG: thrombospondin type 3 repeat-containing protein [Myxococcaceae bacterium]
MARRLTCLLVMMATSALAQPQPVPGFELERFTFNPGARHTMTLGSADLLEQRQLSLGLVGHYAHDPLVFTVDGARVGALVSSRVTAHLVAGFGIFDWLEVGLQLPLVAFQRGDDLSAYGLLPVAATALGAPLLQGRVAFLRQDRGRPLDLGLMLGLTLPLGTAAALTKDPGLGLAFVPRVQAGYSFGPVRVGADVGVTVRGSEALSPTSTVIIDEVGSQFAFGLAASTTRALHVIRGEVGLRGLVPFTKSAASLEVLLGARAAFLEHEQLEVFLLGGPGLGGTPGTPAFRAMLGLTWVPKFGESAAVAGPDGDGDGVDDARDRCPETRGVSEKQGCPDTDSDGDGVMDLVDACPKQAGVATAKGCPEEP